MAITAETNQSRKEWVLGFRKAFQKGETQECDGREEDDLAHTHTHTQSRGEGSLKIFSHQSFLYSVFKTAIHFWKAKESRTDLRIIGRSLHHMTTENISTLVTDDVAGHLSHTFALWVWAMPAPWQLGRAAEGRGCRAGEEQSGR